MPDDAAQFGRDVAALDDVTTLQTDDAVHVYAARLTTDTDGQSASREVRLFTPAPDLPQPHYDSVVDALSAWSELSGHTAITTVYATGETPRPWLAAAGDRRPLTEVAPLSADQARSVLAAVAEALRHGRTAGHEWVPVEPSDVRVRADDTTAATLDWPVDPNRWETASDSGHDSETDESSVARLGAVAHYALTGACPGQNDDEQTAQTSPSTVDSDVPTQFGAVVERALDPDPGQRYDSPYAFKRAVLFESQEPDTTASASMRGDADPERAGSVTAEREDDGPPDPRTETPTGPSQGAGRVSRRAMLGAVGVGAAVTTVGGTWVAATRVFGSTADRFPMFRYDAANTGHVADGSGPTDGVTELWRVDADSPVNSSPVVSEDTVFLNDRDGQLYALAAADGTETWREETERSLPIAGTVADGRVHRSEEADDGTAVTARGMATGTEYWSESTGEVNPLARTVAVDDGLLYTLGSGGVQVHDTETGDEQWLSSRVSVSSLTAAVGDDTLYFGGERANERGVGDRQSVIAFDTDERDIRWSVETNGTVTSSPAVADGVVYVGSNDYAVYAFNVEDGTERWRFETEGPITSSPAVTDHQGGTVYVGGTDRRVYAIDTSDGTERWQYEANNSVISSPAVASDTVYVGGQGGTVYALDAESGDPRWTFDAGEQIISSPAVVSNRLFIGTTEGTIYALTEP